ncbi:MAG TPA: branched-chain amino acid ABC transporter permease [Desulfobacteraceae bacterium]|nr:branched-chain amino acid ABC transporter permease [Desulfobacteraceae bacterium]
MNRYLSVIAYLFLSLAIVAAVKADLLDLYLQLVIMYIGINIILCSSLNLINGYMGEFSCGHAGFMAVGAYVSSILNVWLFTNDPTFGAMIFSPTASIFLFPITLIIGGIAAALVGLFVAVPSFRTRGDYLAIITLAVNYIIKSAVENMQIIGGARGFMGMKKVVNGMEEIINIPWVMIWTLIFTALCVWMLYRFVNSTYGKGIMAIRDDEIAAEIMSVNTQRMKLTAFMLSSGLAGVAGGLFAHILGYINPGSFTIMKSTEVMVMVYLGGMGSLTGSVLSAVSFTILMELLRPLQVWKWVLIPLVLIILMMFRPEGIMGHRELTDIFPKLRRFFPKKSDLIRP